MLSIFGRRLSLQVGSLVLATSIITSGVCTVLTNVLAVQKDSATSWTVVMLFFLLSSVTWSIAFVGTYKESARLLGIAQIMWSIGICIWILLIVCSVIPVLVSYVCIETRCPETMWLIQSPRPYESDEDNYNVSKTNSSILYDMLKHPQRVIMSVVLLCLNSGIFVYAWIYLNRYKESICPNRIKKSAVAEHLN